MVGRTFNGSLMVALGLALVSLGATAGKRFLLGVAARHPRGNGAPGAHLV
jgi:hypothetical protein